MKKRYLDPVMMLISVCPLGARQTFIVRPCDHLTVQRFTSEAKQRNRMVEGTSV